MMTFITCLALAWTSFFYILRQTNSVSGSWDIDQLFYPKIVMVASNVLGKLRI
jgi:hypothetical protein